MDENRINEYIQRDPCAQLLGAKEQSNTGPIGHYDITIKDDRTGEVLAKSQDLSYRKKDWFVPNDDNN